MPMHIVFPKVLIIFKKLTLALSAGIKLNSMHLGADFAFVQKCAKALIESKKKV
jgi:hypothetical protein